MGFLRTPEDYLVLSLIASAFCLQGAVACLEGWSLLDGSCYQVMERTNQSSAIHTCRTLGGRLPQLPSNGRALSLLHLQDRRVGVTSLWLPNRLLRQNDSSLVVVDENNKTTTTCQECNKLTSSLDESCITFSEAGWMAVNCSDTFQYACQMDRAQVAGNLQAAEIAAIICGIFLIICVIVVFVLDIIKHPGKEDEVEFAAN